MAQELEAEEAIRKIIKYIGDDPDRGALLKTPKRVVKSYKEIFSGYNQDPKDLLNNKFHEKAKFNDQVLLRDIAFHSVCEHHFLPIVGTVDIVYIPGKAIVGISKLARIVEIYARRLQIQERMNSEIAETIHKYLEPEGVAVRIKALHFCMSMRGVKQSNSKMETFHYTGVYADKNSRYREEFLNLIRN